MTNIHDTFNAPVTLEVSAPVGWTASGAGWTCALVQFSSNLIDCTRSGAVAAGPSTLPTVTVTGTVPSTYDGTQPASVSVKVVGDYVTGNDSTQVTVPVSAPVDLGVTIGAAGRRCVVGTPFTVPVHVVNHGSAPTGSVEVDVQGYNVDGLAVTGSGWTARPTAADRRACDRVRTQPARSLTSP